MTTWLRKHKEIIILVLIYTALFVSLIYPYSDYDWGWHLKYGLYFWTHGHPLWTDIYSWTMPGFPWTNHEWTYDPFFYLVFTRGGYLGASLVGAGIALLCFFIVTMPYKLKYWQTLIAAFFFSQLTEEGLWQGLRSQVVGYIPLAILMAILVKAKKNIKLLYWLPLLFWIWANVHGTYAVGLAITGVFFAYNFIQSPNARKTYVWIGLASLAATLINPFGLAIYHEVIKHATSPYLQNVTEWLPIWRDCSYCNVPTVALYVLFLIFAAISTDIMTFLPLTIVAAALLYPAINQRRNLPVFGLASLPLLLSYLEQSKIDLSRFKSTVLVVIVILLVTIEYNLVTRLPSYHFYTYNENDYCTFGPNCSPGLATYLRIHPPVGNGFNMYDWGGYLIGKDVPVQLFIDGRMHLWEASDGYMPFADMVAFYFNHDWRKFDNYDFKWVAVPPQSDLSVAIESGKVNGLWRVAYQDDKSIYFVRTR